MEDENPFGDPTYDTAPTATTEEEQEQTFTQASDDYVEETPAVEISQVTAPVNDSLFGDEPVDTFSSGAQEEDTFGDVTVAAVVPAADEVMEEEPVAAPVAQPHRPAPPVPTPRKSSMTDVAIKTRSADAPVDYSSQFEITVQDPIKKGDGMGAYVVYTIVTKTELSQYRSPKLTVTRRYNHFVWLFTQLSQQFPGLIIPPIPEKKSIGRFKDSLIGERRAALEKCLRRIVAHPLLFETPDVILFLSEEDIDGAIKHRKSETKKGLFSSISDAMHNATHSKFNDTDTFFVEKSAQIDQFEHHLKTVLKAVEVLVKHRRDLAASCGTFGTAMASLGSSETHKTLSSVLVNLGQNEEKVKEIFGAQADAEEDTIETILEDYLRVIASARNAFAARAKSHYEMTSAEGVLKKKEEALGKAKANPKAAAKVAPAEKEVEEAEANVKKTKQAFEDISNLVKDELEKFDKERFEDMHGALSQYVEIMIEKQKNVVNVWRDYLGEVQAL